MPPLDAQTADGQLGALPSADPIATLIDGLADAILIIDGQQRVMLHNRAGASLFGVEPDGLVGVRIGGSECELVGTDGYVLSDSRTLLEQASHTGLRLVGFRLAGSRVRWVHVKLRELASPDAATSVYALIMSRATDPRVNQTLQSLGETIGGTPDHALPATDLFGQRLVGMVEFDIGGRIALVNDRFAEMAGVPPTELVGRLWSDIGSPSDKAEFKLAMRRMLSGGLVHHDGDCLLRQPGGRDRLVRVATTPARDEDGRCISFTVQVVDVSRQRRAEDFVSKRALFDPLTQLISRTLLIDLLSDHLRGRTTKLGVIALNLDRFKSVNYSLGQSAGDAILVEVASRLRETIRPGDTAARLSGDDFVLLCGSVASRQQAELMTRRVLDALAEPMDIAGMTIELSASAGLMVIAPSSGLTGDEVIMMTSQALHRAKSRGRARMEFVDRDSRADGSHRLLVETSLRAALTKGRLHLAHQPLLDLTTNEIIGAEALVRWEDPTLGSVVPSAFLPIAEDSGLIVPLGQFVVREAVLAVSRWRSATGKPLYVSVNLSPRELNTPGIAASMLKQLDQVGLPSSALRLEITETVVMEADDQVTTNLHEIHESGIAIGIDDFGTGYASMSYLRSLPVDFVKIDRSFVAGLETSREDDAIVRATVDLSRQLGLVTIAEGIENPRQLEILTGLGCDIGQGFLIGRPRGEDALLARMRA